MKISSPRPFRLLFYCGFAAVGVSGVHAAATMVNLGTAGGFGVLAGTAITVTGASFVGGDAGTSSGTAVSGPGSLNLTGINHGGDAVTLGAQNDLTTAYLNAAAQPADFNYPDVSDLGGLTLTPGVHKGTSSLAITGVLTLDAAGDPNAIWVFQAFSSLTTAGSSSVVLMNGASARNIFWQVGSSATLGTGSSLKGSILALTAITLTTGAVVDGGVYARNAAVTFDTNTVGVPEPVTGMLALAGLFATGFRRSRS